MTKWFRGRPIYTLFIATFLEMLIIAGCTKNIEKPSTPNPPDPPEVIICDTTIKFSVKKLEPLIPAAGNPSKDSVYYTVVNKEQVITNRKTSAVLETKRFGAQDTLLASFSSPSGVIYHLGSTATAGKVSVIHRFENKAETISANVLSGIGLSMKDGAYKGLDAKTRVTTTKPEAIISLP